MATWKKLLVSGSNVSQLNNDAGYIASLGGGIVSGSSQIDHDATTNFVAGEHFLQSAITTVGTIGTGVWNGTAINQTYLVGQSGTNTGDETTASVNALDITEVGTITSGVWNGTAINQTYLVGQSGTNTGDEPDADASTKGIVELATTAETTTGTDATRAVTPDGLKDGYKGSANVNTLGTIATGVWQGTAINQTYLVGQSGTNTGDQDLSGYLLNTTDTLTGDLTVTGDLIIQGDQVSANVTNLDIEDRFILLNSGSSTVGDSGIVFGGANGTAQSGAGLVWDASYNSNDGRLSIVNILASNATGDQTPNYHLAGVFEGTAVNAATAQADHVGNIRVESDEIYIYV